MVSRWACHPRQRHRVVPSMGMLCICATSRSDWPTRPDTDCRPPSDPMNVTRTLVQRPLSTRFATVRVCSQCIHTFSLPAALPVRPPHARAHELRRLCACVNEAPHSTKACNRAHPCVQFACESPAKRGCGASATVPASRNALCLLNAAAKQNWGRAEQAAKQAKKKIKVRSFLPNSLLLCIFPPWNYGGYGNCALRRGRVGTQSRSVSSATMSAGATVGIVFGAVSAWQGPCASAARRGVLIHVLFLLLG